MIYTLIHARIYDYHQYIDDGYIIFNERIIDIGTMENFHDIQGSIHIDCRHHLIIPGFVSGHTHLYLTLARGMDLPFDPKNFMDILTQRWWKMDHFLDHKLVYTSALMGGIDQLQHGTTTFIDHHASGMIQGSLDMIYRALVEELDLPCVLCLETSDRFNIENSIKENIDFMNRHPRDASGLFGLHASLSLSNETLEKVSRVLMGRGIHIHVAESQMDEIECVNRYGMRVVERLEHFGLINNNALLAHCTHINADEMAIIKKHDATIVINPTSNLNNAVGITQVRQFLEMGIRVIVGNDGLIPSQPLEYLNAYYLSHLYNNSAIGLSLEEVRQLMINTYEYANKQLQTSLGRFDKGADADLLVVSYQPFSPINHENIFSHLFFGVFPGFRPKHIFAKGKMVMDAFGLLIDKEEMYEEATKQAHQLWMRIKKEGENLEFTNTV